MAPNRNLQTRHAHTLGLRHQPLCAHAVAAEYLPPPFHGGVEIATLNSDPKDDLDAAPGMNNPQVPDTPRLKRQVDFFSGCGSDDGSDNCHPKPLFFWNATSIATAIPNTLFFGILFILADAHSTAGCPSIYPSHRSSAHSSLTGVVLAFFPLHGSFYESFLVFRERRPSRPSSLSGAPLFT
jgi:hypothetical protein